MAEIVVRVVDVYLFREEGGRVEHLLMHRAAGKVYAGQWRMVGGKIREDETAWEAAFREVHEETGQEPERLWSVPSVNAFYEWRHDRLNLIPAFAASLAADPVLDDEHDAFAWFGVDEAASRLAWPEQQRLLRLVDRLLREGVPPELFVRGGPR